MHPLHFRPILKRMRWGGRRLGTLLGKPLGEGSDYAESWEIADCGPDQTTVVGGVYQGWTLRQLVETHGTAILGLQSTADHFPLLIKFLDAHDRLSVQVHPNDDQARRLGRGPRGKTEAWLVLFAEPHARLYTGLKRGVDRAAFVGGVDRNRIEECLHSYHVHPGDCVMVPAGTVHAIGEGIVLAEIQQSSDLTFRIDDWGRLGADGKPRMLHRDEALECIDFDRGPVDPIKPQRHEEDEHQVENLVACPYFEMRRHVLTSSWRLPDDERFRILMPLAGHAEVHHEAWRQTLGLGDTLLIPACLERVTVAPASPEGSRASASTIVLEVFVR
ncbi:MAG TPA: type I phosphomannose isomerase catalytic subunit [Planctomycetaceae bacterium]|nr:type I phosphomannose isomerase catalytic subunit [Planctomycetaceae bacterium]